jgi:transcriptional regulator with XRE-family HTH domain
MNTEDRNKKLMSLIVEPSAKAKKLMQWELENDHWTERSFMIALLILDELEARNWTQKHLAQELGVSAQQVSKILKGKENLSLSTISKLEKALGIMLIEVNQEPFMTNTLDWTNQILNKASSAVSATESVVSEGHTPYQNANLNVIEAAIEAA